jgi:hypothetical protein
VDIIVAEGGIQVVVPLLSIFQPDEPPNLREFVVNRSGDCAASMQWHTMLHPGCWLAFAWEGPTLMCRGLCAAAMAGRRLKRRRASCWACWPSSQSTSMQSQTGAPCR